MRYIAIALILVLGALTTTTTSASAQIYNKKSASPERKVPSQTAAEYASRVAKTCVSGKWETQPCLKAISENNLVMAANYAADLQEKGRKADSDKIQEHCAAATAATRGEFPAYALRSAYVECVNMIYDVSAASGIKPELSQYQLLVSAVQCMDKAAACGQIEKGLLRYK